MPAVEEEVQAQDDMKLLEGEVMEEETHSLDQKLKKLFLCYWQLTRINAAIVNLKFEYLRMK